MEIKILLICLLVILIAILIRYKPSQYWKLKKVVEPNECPNCNHNGITTNLKGHSFHNICDRCHYEWQVKYVKI